MKKLLLALCAVSLVAVPGCGKKDKDGSMKQKTTKTDKKSKSSKRMNKRDMAK